MESAKRLARMTLGFALLAVGAVMIILPGPGLVTMALGLAVLSSDFPWARRLLDRLKAAARGAKDRVTGKHREG